MKRRIAAWALLGAAIACCWILVGFLAGPAHNLGRSTFVAFTAPASVLGRRAPLSIASFILLNGILYAVIGLTTELARYAGFRHHQM